MKPTDKIISYNLDSLQRELTTYLENPTTYLDKVYENSINPDMALVFGNTAHNLLLLMEEDKSELKAESRRKYKLIILLSAVVRIAHPRGDIALYLAGIQYKDKPEVYEFLKNIYQQLLIAERNFVKSGETTAAQKVQAISRLIGKCQLKVAPASPTPIATTQTIYATAARETLMHAAQIAVMQPATRQTAASALSTTIAPQQDEKALVPI